MPRSDPSDIRSQPAYTLSEAARYVKVAPATLRSWLVGRDYPKGAGKVRSAPLIRPARNPPAALSFWNLIEAHVLRSLRTDHGVKMDALRRAIRYAEQHLQIERLLLSPALRTNAGKLLLERYGELIELSASGQVAMKHVFEAHLARVEWDARKFPIRLYPVIATETLTAAKPIAIDPQIAFGRPILAAKGIKTSTIVERMDAGESANELAEDYELTPEQIEEAVLYERAA